MINAKSFLTDKKYRQFCIDWRTDPTCSSSNNDGLIVQLAGGDALTLLSAARLIQHDPQVQAIDLNLGCPQNCAKRGNYGAHLLYNNQQQALSILQSMVSELEIPITAKGFDSVHTLEMLPAFVE